MGIRIRFRRLAVIGPAIAAVFAFLACSPVRSGKEAGPNTGLEARFALQEGAAENLKRDVEVIRRGERKRALVLIAPAVIKARPDIETGKGTLTGWAAPVFNSGDGIEMRVCIRRGETRIQAGSRYFDPGRRTEDRNWIPIAVPLELEAGDILEIEAAGGPQGDLVADWLALNSLRLMR